MHLGPALDRVGTGRPVTFRIETQRTLIRPWEEPDREPFARIATDPRVMHYISDGRPWTDDEIDEFLANQQRHVTTNGFCLGALCLGDARSVVGLCGMQPLGTTPDVEIGWWLAPEHWGRGLATEAARGVVDFARRETGRSRVLAIARPENRASTRIMEKLGMRLSGYHTGRELGLRQLDVEVVAYRLELAPSSAETSSAS